MFWRIHCYRGIQLTSNKGVLVWWKTFLLHSRDERQRSSRKKGCAGIYPLWDGIQRKIFKQNIKRVSRSSKRIPGKCKFNCCQLFIKTIFFVFYLSVKNCSSKTAQTMYFVIGKWCHKIPMPEVYLEPCQASTIGLSWENSWRLSADNYFRKKHHCDIW